MSQQLNDPIPDLKQPDLKAIEYDTDINTDRQSFLLSSLALLKPWSYSTLFV